MIKHNKNEYISWEQLVQDVVKYAENKIPTMKDNH
jgi:hypothetical protein